MKIGIIVGSQRVRSQSRKVAGVAQALLSELDKSAKFFTLDLAEKPLPFWDEGVWAGDAGWKKIWGPIAEELKSCDGFVVIAPEYHGMAPAALKNFFLLAGKDEIGHKPGLIVAVSAARGGSYPVAELRLSSYKNSRLVWLPDHVIVRNAETVLNGGQVTGEEDQFTRSRLQYCLSLLLEYSKALGQVRHSGVVDFKNHPNGM
jgi:NAD(P)H-dependent FMN reductase